MTFNFLDFVIQNAKYKDDKVGKTQNKHRKSVNQCNKTQISFPDFNLGFTYFCTVIYKSVMARDEHK